MKTTSLTNILVISAPSGTGKTTIIKELSKKEPLRYSISHTTRPKRVEEIDGLHYHFVTKKEFQELNQGGAFLEVAYIHDHWYGTSWKSLTMNNDSNQWLMLDIDTQGFSSIKRKVPDIVSVFILPPNLEALKDRILNRQPNIDKKELELRLGLAKSEIAQAFDYDYTIFNDVLDNAIDELSFILRCEKLKSRRRRSLIELLCY